MFDDTQGTGTEQPVLDGGERQRNADTDQRLTKLFGIVWLAPAVLHDRFSTLTINELDSENRLPAKPMAKCSLYLSKTIEWQPAIEHLL